MDDEFMRLETKEIERRLEALKAEFEADSESEGAASLRTIIGDPTKGLATAARAADLVIAGAERDGAEHDTRDSIDLGELIHSAGRPVLIPRDNLEPIRANSVVVAWKDAREARRAEDGADHGYSRLRDFGASRPHRPTHRSRTRARKAAGVRILIACPSRLASARCWVVTRKRPPAGIA